MTPKNLFASAGVPPRNPPTPPVRPKSLFDNATPAVSGVYIPATIVVNGTRNDKPTGPKTLLTDAKIRKRIDVTIDQLRKYGEDVNVLKLSQQQIFQTNVDELCLNYVLDWGAHIQTGHSLLLQEVMALTTAPALLESKTLIGSIIHEMSSIDIMNATKDSWFKKKETKAANLMDKLKELKDIANKFRVDWLLSLHKEGTQMKTKYANLIKEISPYIITCSFFSEYDKDDFPKELYVTRLSSLLSTKASLGNDVSILDSILTTYVNVIETINSIVRNELPLWISNLTAVLAGNASDLTQIQLTQSKITNKLKSIL